MFDPSAAFILSNYFDKALFDVGATHFEWSRNPSNLETDGLEFIITQPEESIPVTCVLYPDFPIPYFIVPDHLRHITGTSVDYFARVLRLIIAYASANSLFLDNDIVFDTPLAAAFGTPMTTVEQLPVLLQSILSPLAPISLSFVLKPTAPIYNVNVLLPDFSKIPASPVSVNPDLNGVFLKFAKEKEAVDLMAAIARNPYEAIEAEITGHATLCELEDETGEKGPTVNLDPMNPARRSTPFYWQPWVADYVPRFLEENKMIHTRYVQEAKRPRKPKGKKVVFDSDSD
jgi:hypothetical protein